MKVSVRHKIFLLLSTLTLPLFFALHGWNQSFGLVTLGGFLHSLLFLSFLVCMDFIFALWLIKNPSKALLFCLFTSSLIFFYPYSSSSQEDGSDHTGLIRAIILFVIIIMSLFFYLKKTKKEFSFSLKYVQILLCILVITETVILLFVTFNKENATVAPFVKKEHLKSNIEKLPSVYVILLDEYAGKESLTATASFNNEEFVNSLQKLGFKVIKNASSNYDYTVFSVASFLNGDYISLKKPIYNNHNYKPCLYAINNNRTVATFKELGYKTINLSPFDFSENERFYKSFSLPGNGELILRPTIIDDILELAPLFITRRLPDKFLFKKSVEQKVAGTINPLHQLLAQAKQKNSLPVFCYAHIMMPHAMYAKDSMGEVNLPFLLKKPLTDEDKKQAYIQYLVYTNKTVLPFIKEIRQNAGDSAIILLLSDHGSRDLAVDHSYKNAFSSLAAVYSPVDGGRGWYDGMSNVNQFRVLFSTLTGYELPLLKDSTITE